MAQYLIEQLHQGYTPDGAMAACLAVRTIAHLVPNGAGWRAVEAAEQIVQKEDRIRPEDFPALRDAAFAAMEECKLEDDRAYAGAVGHGSMNAARACNALAAFAVGGGQYAYPNGVYSWGEVVALARIAWRSGAGDVSPALLAARAGWERADQALRHAEHRARSAEGKLAALGR